MNCRTLFLALLTFASLLAGTALCAAQTGSFTVSQNGRSVGTASYTFRPTATGIDSSSMVKVSMTGLNYQLSKTEELTSDRRLLHVQLSASVNGSAVNVVAKPDAAQLLMNTSANGRSSTSRLVFHRLAVLLPDFDPGALETLLALGASDNNRDLWVIEPKGAGAVKAVQMATYADEQGTYNGQKITVHHLVATIGEEETHLFTGQGNELLQAELPQEGFALVRSGFTLTPPNRPGAAPTPPPAQGPATPPTPAKPQ